jgi:hypothetical protein
LRKEIIGVIIIIIIIVVCSQDHNQLCVLQQAVSISGTLDKTRGNMQAEISDAIIIITALAVAIVTSIIIIYTIIVRGPVCSGAKVSLRRPT